MSYSIIYKKYITRNDLKSNPTKIFVFGDNDERFGFGGQAKEMRGERNAVGIRVKKSPSMQPYAFYTDEEYDHNIKKIQEDLLTLEYLANNKTIVFPENGIGTGLAGLGQHAPKTYVFLNKILYDQFTIINGKDNFI